MPQGWAGNAPMAKSLNCAPCGVTYDRQIVAYTQINGTLLCLLHAKEWIERGDAVSLAALFKASS